MNVNQIHTPTSEGISPPERREAYERLSAAIEAHISQDEWPVALSIVERHPWVLQIEETFNNTYLIKAIQAKNELAVDRLLQLGASPNEQRPSHAIPLNVVMGQIDLELHLVRRMATLLLDAGAEVNPKTDRALVYSVNAPRVPDIVRRLIAQGAPLNSSRVARHPMTDLVREGMKLPEGDSPPLDLCHLLLDEYPGKIQCTAYEAQAALLGYCVWNRAFELADRLVAYGFDPHKRYGEGKTLMHVAVDRPAMQWLIDKGLSIDEPDEVGETPLLGAIREAANFDIDEALPVMRDLILCGANLDACDLEAPHDTPRSRLETQDEFRELLILVRSIEARQAAVAAASQLRAQSIARSPS